ncbi:hypothetical protein EXIGLDRAFT_747481 [Exidia glandulosa HHB12029]|uniref:Uncharacterized protein n=1 Tax=Exidia glandulosa HHB12029 TaxID=1314781 RepID=A0A165KSY5_EXIGL|nr:hypothetical protein EXIGLDRAFT_747481 [Exidia glandulosa HHB12029]
MSTTRKKSNWPEPGVQGLTTRRQAAQTPDSVQGAKIEQQKKTKGPALLNEVQNTTLPSSTKAKPGKQAKPKDVDTATDKEVAKKTLTPKTATPTTPAPGKSKVQDAAKPKKHDSAGKTAADKTAADKTVVDAGVPSPNKTPDAASKVPAEKTPDDAASKIPAEKMPDDAASKIPAEAETDSTDAGKITDETGAESTIDGASAAGDDESMAGNGEGDGPKFVNVDDLDFDLSFLDDDLLAAALGGSDDEEDASVPGPLPAALQAIWDQFLSACANFVVKFSGASRKTTQILWNMLGEEFKLTRNPNIYNMWVKKWSLLNGMEEGESKHDYHRRYVDAYHEAMDDMSAEDKKKTRIELLDWLRSYEKECAKEAERRGSAFKGVLDTKQAITRTSQQLARKNNVVIWGVVVPLKHGDAKSIASGGSFCSHDGMTTVMKELGVNVDDLCGDIAVGFGAKYLANRLLNDWSDEALYQILKKVVGDRRFYLRRVLLAIWNVGLKVETDNLTWKGNASVCVKRGVWYDKWPRGIDPPDIIGDNKYSESDHNTLMEAAYKTMRKEPGHDHIEIKPYTEEELSWRRKDWKRWCALPVYRDTDGKILIRVGDVMPSEEMDVKLKGRIPRMRVTEAKTTTASDDKNDDDNDTLIAHVEKPTLRNQKRPRRSDEEYSQLLEGGGTDGYWDVAEPVLKRRAVKYPGYEEVAEMDVDEVREPSVGPSSRAQSAQPGLTIEALQQQMIAAQRQQMFQSQQMMAGLMQQLVGRGALPGFQQQQQQTMGNAGWSLPAQMQMQGGQQQQQMPSLDDWMPDGQGGFMSLNGN